MAMTTLERRVVRIEAAVGDDGGGGHDCPTCSPAPAFCWGPWREPPPSPCPRCGREFVVETFTLHLRRPWHDDDSAAD